MLKPGARLLLGLLLVSGVVVAGRLAWAGQVRGVQIRVLNNSDYDFQNLVVNDVSFGSLTKARLRLRPARTDGAAPTRWTASAGQQRALEPTA